MQPQYGPTEFDERAGPWLCKACGEGGHFIGIDAHGWGGPSECECDAYDEEGDRIKPCECETELRQPLTIMEGADEPNYGLFTGGGDNAEIGSYTSVECGRCGALLWEGE